MLLPSECLRTALGGGEAGAALNKGAARAEVRGCVFRAGQESAWCVCAKWSVLLERRAKKDVREEIIGGRDAGNEERGGGLGLSRVR